jgi:hypothetical protein
MKSQIHSKLDEEIISLLDKLDNHTSTSEEYSVIVDRIAQLHKLKSEERLKLPSLDTVLMVSANIFGVLWVCRYEREHVLTSKSLGIAFRPR